MSEFTLSEDARSASGLIGGNHRRFIESVSHDCVVKVHGEGLIRRCICGGTKGHWCAVGQKRGTYDTLVLPCIVSVRCCSQLAGHQM